MPINDSALGIDFNFEAMEGLIGDRSTSVVHEIAIACTCIHMNANQGPLGQADISCKKCFGQGIVYRDPAPLDGLLAGLSSNRFWAQVSWIQPGDLSFAPSLHARRLSDRDRIQITLPTPTEGQVLLRGVESSLSVRPLSLKENQDYLWWEAGRDVAIWVEDEDDIIYAPGDYLFLGRRIEWRGKQPAKGKRYVIKYEAYPEFVCWATPFDRWDRQREIGQRVLLRKAVFNPDPKQRPIREPWRESLDNAYFSEGRSSQSPLLSPSVDPPK